MVCVVMCVKLLQTLHALLAMPCRSAWACAAGFTIASLQAASAAVLLASHVSIGLGKHLEVRTMCSMCHSLARQKMWLSMLSALSAESPARIHAHIYTHTSLCTLQTRMCCAVMVSLYVVQFALLAMGAAAMASAVLRLLAAAAASIYQLVAGARSAQQANN